MKIFNLLETQYVKFTSAVKSYLSNQLSQFESTYGNSTIFGQLINVLSGVVQNIMLYIEDALTEQNKYTAQRKKSIYGLAALSGYQPSLGKATGVQLKFNYVPTTSQGLNVIVNNHQVMVCTQNGLHYNLILPQEAIVMSIEKDNSTRYIYAVQGKFESQSFVSNGGRYYTQNFKYLGHMDPDYMEVRINNEVWECVASVYDMIPDGAQYTYKVNPFGGVDLVFGNDIHGRALRNGDVIYVSYLIHDGELGNVDVNTETYFIFNDSLRDINGETLDGNILFNVTFATNDAVTSGTNSEDTEQVRQMIGLNSRALVLADPKNYKTFINKFSFCGYNRTWSEPGSLVVNSLIMKNYKMLMDSGLDYFNLTESDFKLTDFQKESIIHSIEKSGNQLAGVTYNIFEPELCKYALYLYVTLKNSTYDREYIKNQIRKIVGEFFSEVESDIFVPKSDIIHLIKSKISAIDGLDAYFISERNETALRNGYYKDTTTQYNPSTGTFDKKTETIKLYPGENPNLGLDSHGNILLQNDEQFPVLMKGWSWRKDDLDNTEIQVTDSLNIIFV